MTAWICFTARKDENDLTVDGRLLRPVLSLEDVGLSYPLQTSDLVDNWEEINVLWQAFHRDEKFVIALNAMRNDPILPN